MLLKVGRFRGFQHHLRSPKNLGLLTLRARWLGPLLGRATETHRSSRCLAGGGLPPGRLHWRSRKRVPLPDLARTIASPLRPAARTRPQSVAGNRPGIPRVRLVLGPDRRPRRGRETAAPPPWNFPAAPGPQVLRRLREHRKVLLAKRWSATSSAMHGCFCGGGADVWVRWLGSLLGRALRGLIERYRLKPSNSCASHL